MLPAPVDADEDEMLRKAITAQVNEDGDAEEGGCGAVKG